MGRPPADTEGGQLSGQPGSLSGLASRPPKVDKRGPKAPGKQLQPEDPHFSSAGVRNAGRNEPSPQTLRPALPLTQENRPEPLRDFSHVLTSASATLPSPTPPPATSFSGAGVGEEDPREFAVAGHHLIGVGAAKLPDRWQQLF